MSHDHVLMTGGKGSYWPEKRYHQPSEDDPDKPACNFGSVDKNWRRVHPEKVQHKELCKLCSGDSEEPGPRGEILAAKLSRMDASEVV